MDLVLRGPRVESYDGFQNATNDQVKQLTILRVDLHDWAYTIEIDQFGGGGDPTVHDQVAIVETTGTDSGNYGIYAGGSKMMLLGTELGCDITYLAEKEVGPCAKRFGQSVF